MGFFRRFLSVGLGIAAGAFAYKLLKDYNDDGHIDGEYVELPPEQGQGEQEAPAAPAGGAADAAPNPNPVELGAAEKPLTGDGRLDATRIASPEDFGDWDDLGCKG
ncbi:hypothetical protein [Allofournierella sp.]|uniref:hypothetical protein n=1 Tax=Allofournierella sp. TaxID=1940256 RepID=UPI003AB3421A